MDNKKPGIKGSSTAEYFAKNLQQVGFSSHQKAVLTTLKEAVDNALDACEEASILPEIFVSIKKIGPGSLKNCDQIQITVEDNGPGIDPQDVPKVFGEYLASSKFGQGRCSRGQQGIGISAATTYAQLTSARGVEVITKTQAAKKAFQAIVEVDIKKNQGILKNKQTITWDKTHGTRVTFNIDGRLQINGDAGLLNYLNSTVLVNPHLSIVWNLPDCPAQTINRVSMECPIIPEKTAPHPHTMKLGEFIAYSHLFAGAKLAIWLKKGFSRITDSTLQAIQEAGFDLNLFDKPLQRLSAEHFKQLFSILQTLPLLTPSTKSLMAIGETVFEKSIQRIGDIDFFAVISRKPTICDFKPIQVEVGMARVQNSREDINNSISVLRFANRVPLQFDKSSCAIVKAIESVNWRAYGLAQSKNALPQGPYIIAVSVVSPFIKFKNASKETIDASEELVMEIRRALIQVGQKLSKYIRKEQKASELEKKMRHIEQFCPILVDGLCRITQASEKVKNQANLGLIKILGKETSTTLKELQESS